MVGFDVRTVDDIMLLAWSRTATGGSEHIYVSQLPLLLEIVQSMAGIAEPILSKNQKQLLQTMIRDNSRLKLYKRELPRFLTRLTQTNSLSELFDTKKGSKSGIFDRWEMPNFISSSKFRPQSTNYGSGSRNYNTEPYLSPPSSPPRSRQKYTIPFSDEKYNYHSAPASSGDAYYSSKIQRLEAQCEQYQKSYKALELLCEEYQQELYKRGPELEGYRSGSRLSQYIPRNALHAVLNSLTATFKGTNSRATTLAHVVTLFVAASVVVNIFKVLVYGTVLLLTPNISPGSYVYDNYDPVLVQPVWWKEIEMLEYWVYMIQEWVQ